MKKILSRDGHITEDSFIQILTKFENRRNIHAFSETLNQIKPTEICQIL